MMNESTDDKGEIFSFMDEGDENENEAERQLEGLQVPTDVPISIKITDAPLSVSQIVRDHAGLNPASFDEDPQVM